LLAGVPRGIPSHVLGAATPALTPRVSHLRTLRLRPSQPFRSLPSSAGRLDRLTIREAVQPKLPNKVHGGVVEPVPWPARTPASQRGLITKSRVLAGSDRPRETQTIPRARKTDKLSVWLLVGSLLRRIRGTFILRIWGTFPQEGSRQAHACITAPPLPALALDWPRYGRGRVDVVNGRAVSQIGCRRPVGPRSNEPGWMPRAFFSTAYGFLCEGGKINLKRPSRSIGVSTIYAPSAARAEQAGPTAACSGARRLARGRRWWWWSSSLGPELLAASLVHASPSRVSHGRP